jgi:hypothetical protein
MDRGIPSSANEDIELYQRTYYSLLRSSGEIQIKSLIETHTQMDSSLHLNARADFPDLAAFVYSTLRLPDCITQVRHVLLGQSDEVFDKAGLRGVEHWQEVSAAGRRRKMFFDGKETLAAFIASASDIDDLIPMLAAYQIEWNKIHHLLEQSGILSKISASTLDSATREVLARVRVLPLDHAAAVRAGNIPARLHAQGTPIGLEDVLISATALVNELVVVTRNLNAFRED